MTTPLPPKPQSAHLLFDRLRRACELAMRDLNLARERYARTEHGLAKGLGSQTGLDADSAAIREAERRLEAATRYRAAFDRIYTDKSGFAAGFGPSDVMPFQLAWPMPRIYVPGIANPHVPPPNVAKPPKPPRRAKVEPLQAPAKPRVAKRAHAVSANEGALQPETSGPINEHAQRLDAAKATPPIAPEPNAELVVDAAALESALATLRGADEADDCVPADAPKQANPVGYKCPPEHGKFRKGDGRHRPGRSRGAKGLKRIVIKSMGKKVVVTENGKRQSMSRLEALVETSIVAGLGRSPKDRAYAIGLAQKFIPEEEPQATAPLSDDDKEILKSQIALLGMLEDDDDNEGET